jgi:hypothetical protein
MSFWRTKADVVESVGEAPRLGLGATGRVGRHALAAGLPEGVLLQGQCLLVGGITGVPNQRRPIVRKLVNRWP